MSRALSGLCAVACVALPSCGWSLHTSALDSDVLTTEDWIDDLGSDAHDRVAIEVVSHAPSAVSIAVASLAPEVTRIERLRRQLTAGWEWDTDRHVVVEVRSADEGAAFLCGAGSMTACTAIADLDRRGECGPSARVERGAVRPVVIADGRSGREDAYLALAVVRGAPRSGDELADLVLLGRCIVAPTGTTDGDELLLEASREAASDGAETALEVSLDAAWIAARRHLGLDPSFERYVAITHAEPGSGLQSGDRVLYLDGEPVGFGLFFPAAGDPDRDSVFTIVRDGHRISVSTADVDPSALEALEAARSDVERPATIVRPTTSGASAGLVTALAFVDELSEHDLAAGRTIAGTGVITPAGFVQPVRGVEAKTMAAVVAGADVLFVHPDDVDVASSAAGDRIVVVPVVHLRDAVDWLAHGDEKRAES